MKMMIGGMVHVHEGNALTGAEGFIIGLVVGFVGFQLGRLAALWWCR